MGSQREFELNPIQFIFCEIWTWVIFVYSFSEFCRYGCELVVSSERVFVMALSYAMVYIVKIFRFLTTVFVVKDHVEEQLREGR